MMDCNSFIENCGIVQYSRTSSKEYQAYFATASCEMPDCYGDRTALDHCHNHGWIRGILCYSCNVAMAFIDKYANAGRFDILMAPGFLELYKHWQKCLDCANGIPRTMPPEIRRPDTRKMYRPAPVPFPFPVVK